MSPTELDLRATLHEDAARIDTTGDFAAAAIGLEGRRARRRTTIGAVAAVAVLTIAAPLAWSTLRPPLDPVADTRSATMASSPTASSPTASSPTAPTPTASAVPSALATPAPTGGPTRTVSPTVAVTFGPRTGTVRTAYVANGVFHDGGRTVNLPVARDIRFAARLEGGGVVVNAPGAGGAEPLSFVSPSGRVIASFADVQSIAVNDAGTRVVTADAKGTLRLRDAQGKLLNQLATKDPNAEVTGVLGPAVYFSRVDGTGTVTTHTWDTNAGREEPGILEGRIVDVSEARSLALVYPKQDYNPDKTCYEIVDLVNHLVRDRSCGAFAPSHFTGDGTVVVGPAVADGAGSRTWLVASSDDGSILLKVTAGRAFAPSWRAAGKDALVVALVDPDRSRRQVIASCTVSAHDCTVDIDPVDVSAKQRDAMDWPITLSEN